MSHTGKRIIVGTKDGTIKIYGLNKKEGKLSLRFVKSFKLFKAISHNIVDGKEEKIEEFANDIKFARGEKKDKYIAIGGTDN